MRVLSLFSGIGAFEKALERLEIPVELIGFSEIDKYAVKSYCAIHNVEESKNLGDITKIDESSLPKDIDLITYGFPCQDISRAGKEQGMFNEDGTQTRSGLFFEALRIIESTQPRVAIAENVKNLTSKKFSAQFKIVLESLESSGYNNYWAVLNSKHFGIPQTRERVFIVSIRKDCDTGKFEFPEPYPLTKTLQDLLENIVSDEFDVNHDCYEYYLDLSERQIGTKWEGRCNKDFINPSVAHTLSVRGTRHQRPGVSNMISKKNHQQMLVMDYKNHHMEIGDLRWLTPKECFRLMGFDDTDFEKAEKVNSNTQLYKQAGNSIVVPVVEYIIKALFDCGALENERESETKMELKLKEITFPEVIEFNYEELKQEITERVATYKNLVYTDDQIQDAKKDVATLRKFTKALSDERIRVKKDLLKPYEDFESKVKELTAIVDESIKNIDGQVKGYEDQKKAEKLEKVLVLYNGTDFPEWVQPNLVLDEKWLNASVSLASVQKELETKREQIETDLLTLQNLPDFSFEAIEVYKTSLDINQAIQEGKRLSEIQKMKAEQEAIPQATAEPQPAQIEVPETPKNWVSFKAYIDVNDALALRKFFESRNIEYKAI